MAQSTLFSRFFVADFLFLANSTNSNFAIRLIVHNTIIYLIYGDGQNLTEIQLFREKKKLIDWTV